MHPTDKAARIAGAVYLSMVLTAPFSLIYVPGKLIVHGNAAATAANIVNHETMFRLAIIGDLVGQVIFICLAIALYRLLSNVNKTWAGMMVAFVLVSAAVGFLNVLNNIAAVILFRGADFLAVFDKPQRDALGYLFLRLHSQGQFINEIFWGLWLFPFGWLVYRSGFLPRILGAWLMINCFGYRGSERDGVVLPGLLQCRVSLCATYLIWRARDYALASDQGRKGTVPGS